MTLFILASSVAGVTIPLQPDKNKINTKTTKNNFLLRHNVNVINDILFHNLTLPEPIHSFIISLLFSSRTTLKNFKVVPLTFALLSFSFQKSGSLFSVSTLISSFCNVYILRNNGFLSQNYRLKNGTDNCFL